MPDFKDENVLEHAIEAFHETIALKVRQLRRYVPKAKVSTNPELTGAFIEELVRGFIRGWLGDKQLLHGTFYSKQHIDSGEKPMQIDGIVHVPARGPLVINEGDFAILHPAFSAGIIEIKMTISSISKFEERLQTIYGRYLGHLTKPHVLGIVVADKNPEKTSVIAEKDGKQYFYHDYRVANWCPIFVLFQETDDGDYIPFMPGIECMIRAIFGNLYASTNYIG